jgi:aryl-alcohol dehydrogenase-like predicted oxidoreductase
MEFATIPGTSLRISRVGLRTWAIGGGMDEAESVSTIRAAIERGV